MESKNSVFLSDKNCIIKDDTVVKLSGDLNICFLILNMYVCIKQYIECNETFKIKTSIAL